MSIPIYTIQLANFEFDNNNNKSVIQEIKTKTNHLLRSVILIDYNYIHYRLKDRFLGYVNISEKKNMDKWIPELYKILQIIEKKKEYKCCNKIYLTDIDFIVEEDHYSKHIIDILTNKQKIVIPSIFLE